MNLRLVSALIMTVGLHSLSGCRMLKADPHMAFLGDSIVEAWWYPSANLGSHGDTTAKMLARFPLVVPSHGYTTVVVLGGSNDVLLGIDPETTILNLEAIGQQTMQLHAEPVLCQILPIFHGWKPDDRKDYKPQVLELNRRIAQLAAEHRWRLVDFYTPLIGHPNFSDDGVHTNRTGYLLMVVALRRTLSHRHDIAAN